jgi:hypothetical protein
MSARIQQYFALDPCDTAVSLSLVSLTDNPLYPVLPVKMHNVGRCEYFQIETKKIIR